MRIWIIKRNVDMTEGRGPMGLIALAETKEKAFEWANAQPSSENGRHSWRHIPTYKLNPMYGENAYQTESWSNGWGMHEITYMETIS